MFFGESRSPDIDCPETVSSLAAVTPSEVELTVRKPKKNMTTPGQDSLGENLRSTMHATDTVCTVTAENQVLADTNSVKYDTPGADTPRAYTFDTQSRRVDARRGA